MSDIRPAVAVLKGGRSAEREISLVTGAQVEAGLHEAGFPVVTIDTGDPDFIECIRRSEAAVAFICLHGRYGEDGTIQGLLDLLDMPYVGCGVLASALAMDKAMSKAVFNARGVPTPEHVCVRKGDIVDPESIVATIGGRSVVKPVREGSAIGVTIVRDAADLPAALEDAFCYDDDVLVEEFIEGVEITVGVLGTGRDCEALPTLEIVPVNEFYDYVSKYEPGMSQHVIPARISETAQKASAEIALQAHRALGCRGMSRVDLIVTGEDIFVLEVNTIPGMTPTSLLPEAAAAAGISFPDLCARLVEDALAEGPAPACD